MCSCTNCKPFPIQWNACIFQVEQSPAPLQPKLSVSSNADQDDLFSAHDFDIHIDLPTNSNGNLCNSVHQ